MNEDQAEIIQIIDCDEVTAATQGFNFPLELEVGTPPWEYAWTGE